MTGGHDHTCARLTTNALRCWGRSDVGQVGDGSTAVRKRPVAITALGTNVAAVAAGDYHTCATRTDGKLFCWGMNSVGEVGDGSTTLRKLPVVVTALGTTVAELKTGASLSCARLQNGTVSCWGRNDFGQLGDGSTVNRSLPGPVAALSGVTAIAAGEVHNCARRSDGSLWCWGANWGGSLGAAAGGCSWNPFAQSRCGDGVCAYDEGALGGCSADCATTCGDCVCDGVLENAANCAADCVAGNTCTPAICGNGTCNAGEDCSLCPADCGTCY